MLGKSLGCNPATNWTVQASQSRWWASRPTSQTMHKIWDVHCWSITFPKLQEVAIALHPIYLGAPLVHMQVNVNVNCLQQTSKAAISCSQVSVFVASFVVASLVNSTSLSPDPPDGFSVSNSRPGSFVQVEDKNQIFSSKPEEAGKGHKPQILLN